MLLQRFSPCSRRMIAKVLSRKADICFEEEASSFCGNGRVEEGEECDVGMLLTGHEDKYACCLLHCLFSCTQHCFVACYYCVEYKNDFRRGQQKGAQQVSYRSATRS